MKTKKVVKEKLNEVAGISFEVRKWANVIEKYVDDYVTKEKEKLKAQQPKEQPKTTKPQSYSWSYNDDGPGDDEFQTDYTHFETLDGQKHESAKVYGFDLYINPDVLDEYPNIKDAIQDKLFEVELDGKGEFSVDTVQSNFPDTYLYGILEMIKDHMVMGQAFYNDDYDELFATMDDDDFTTVYDYMDYMNEGDPKVGTGKKPKGSSRRLYTDEDPSDTVPVKFRTKEDIVDTLNKSSFKSKSHKRQSQIINLIHQRVRAAHKNAKDEETKKRLKRGLDYITNKKEKSKEKTKRNKVNEDNRWSNYGRSYGGYSYTPQPKIDKIEINGKDFPDAYEDFKVDKWVITNSGRIEYDHWKSGYDKDGNYVVYLNMPMSSVGGSALVHEIKHAYDDWNRMSKGAPPIRAGWEIKNIYTPDFEKLVLGGGYKLSPMLNPIIRYYYLGSKLETPAYLENEYDNASMMGSYRETAKKMMNFKASNFLNKKGQPAKGLQESWTKLITEYNIPFFRKFKNVVDFLKYTEKHFNKRGRNIMRRIDKMRYVHNRPEPKYTPRVYTKPTETKPKEEPKKVEPKDPNQLSLFDQPTESSEEKLNKEIDKLEKQWDEL